MHCLGSFPTRFGPAVPNEVVILLLGGCGLMDPCENVDAAESLTPQQRADITSAAQVCS